MIPFYALVFLASLFESIKAQLPIFSQSIYTFSPATCTPGATIGQVFANVPNGLVASYLISGGNGQYSVDPNTGIISFASISNLVNQNTLPVIRYWTGSLDGSSLPLLVTAISTSGLTSSVPITISSVCNGGLSPSPPPGFFPSNPTPTNNFVGGNSLGAAFTRSSYQFNVACAQNNANVGSVWATAPNGATLNFSLVGDPTKSFFVDPNSGEIRTMRANIPPGTYSMSVQASDGQGGSTINVPLTIVVSSFCG
ncbi:hypothetical protein RvY_13495 [Ramazzottius varieornatus]|uniref:Cadherin domain-containing protein n=1 Tax=Ramazzottius varieornatus TaxID=947166 RepID=A0A1D1VVJ1_RAMVA|nr:hypothetical protein RvY_13495 [Ramazzottius varieornatus]